ncbi:MAG: helix-turn-helix domain-containing protein [Lachnospiraceae bacterium]|nr:helix-turn-helix domain-containing protein [Lachnospiraceae bacterium]
MKNPAISKMLKHYRKLNKLSVQEVADYLYQSKIEVATKTIYGWESGRTQPDADIFMYLCYLYKIDDILGTFGYSTPTENSQQFSDEEKALIEAYRNHPEFKEAINKLLEL